MSWPRPHSSAVRAASLYLVSCLISTRSWVRIPVGVPASSYPNPPQSKQAGMRFQMLNNAHPPGWALFVFRGSWAHRQRWAVWLRRQAEPGAAGSESPRVLWRLVYLVPVVAGCDCSWRWRSGVQAASCSAGVRIPMAECGRMVPVPVDPLGGGEHGRRRCPPKGPGYGSARPCTAS